MDEIEVEPQNNTLAIKISNEIPSKTKDDIFDKTEKHRKSICQIFVSQYMNGTTKYGSDDYVVTRSVEDNSVLGWSVNIERNGSQQPDVYFKNDQISEHIFIGHSVLLSRKSC
jgi:hypothetical protein